MLKNLLVLSTIMFALSFISNAQAAHDVFVCKCIAKGSGVDSNEGQKICSYSCKCNGYDKDQTPVLGNIINVDRVATSARSRDTWDSGSSICHGQYAYKSNLSDPNWKIQVRFSPFNVTSYNNSGVFYDEADEMVEIAIGVKYFMKRSPTAYEIVQSIKDQF
ncbi:MAG: hypothetical protein H7336_15175 [Bacteriovorax sp.]|nr:hypothetical protein [Bacteriovorax sp.]